MTRDMLTPTHNQSKGTHEVAGEARDENVHVGAQVVGVPRPALRRVRLVRNVVQTVRRQVRHERRPQPRRR